MVAAADTNWSPPPLESDPWDPPTILWEAEKGGGKERRRDWGRPEGPFLTVRPQRWGEIYIYMYIQMGREVINLGKNCRETFREPIKWSESPGLGYFAYRKTLLLYCWFCLWQSKFKGRVLRDLCLVRGPWEVSVYCNGKYNSRIYEK